MQRRALGLTIALVVLTVTLSPGLPAMRIANGCAKSLTSVESWDGHNVPISVYQPRWLRGGPPVPVILHSHGWAGSRETSDSAFGEYCRTGYAVVSIDMRGHGEARSTSEARVHHVEYEVRDVSAVLDWLAAQTWVRLDGPGDPRAGAIGGSYGGGYQLLSAALDGRLDALVPEITWNDLPQSLAPNGGIRSAWVDILYAGGNALARVHPTIHQAFAYAMVTNELPDGSVPGTPDLITQFTQSSPGNYPGSIDVPTLIIQGMPDTLFNFNEGAANYEMIKAAGAPVRLVTHLTGHIINTQGTLGGGPIGIGLQPPAGPRPCGSTTDLAIAWFDRHLKHRASVDTGPEVCLALDDGTTVTGDTYPLPGTQIQTFALGGATVPQGAPGATLELPILTATGPTTIAGEPTLGGSAQTVGPDAIVYWSLKATDASTGQSRIVDAQVTPLRLADPIAPTTFAIELGGVATRLDVGDQLVLVVSNVNEQFATNGGRSPGAVALSDLELTLPIV